MYVFGLSWGPGSSWPQEPDIMKPNFPNRKSRGKKGKEKRKERGGRKMGREENYPRKEAWHRAKKDARQ